MEQKLKEIPSQVKDRQKRKGGTKAIRIDAEGDARLEDLMDPESPADTYPTSPAERPVSSKKRKAITEKGTSKPRPQKGPKNLDSLASNATVSGSEFDDRPHQQRTKRPTKSVNENLEPAFTEKENALKTVKDVKIISAGKILENNRTVGECRSPLCVPGGVTTMHVLVSQLPQQKEKKVMNDPKQNKCVCVCVIL